MKCIECGHELKDGAIFCIRCGAMQVSMDGKPIERGQDWPTVDAQSDGSGYRSSADGALHSAQARSPRGFQTEPPKRGGGRIAIIIIVLVVLIALIAFALTQCMAPATSGTDSTTAASQAASATAESSTASSTATSTSSTSASASAASASASAASASASAAAATNQGSTQQAAQAETQQAQPAPEPEPEPVYYNDYYVLPSSSSYYYSYDELSSMSAYDLYIARNEIYARHGRMFNRSDLQDYFNSQAWYEPLYTASQFDSMGNQLSDVELQNAKLMKQVEADKGSPYL